MRRNKILVFLMMALTITTTSNAWFNSDKKKIKREKKQLIKEGKTSNDVYTDSFENIFKVYSKGEKLSKKEIILKNIGTIKNRYYRNGDIKTREILLNKDKGNLYISVIEGYKKDGKMLFKMVNGEIVKENGINNYKPMVLTVYKDDGTIEKIEKYPVGIEKDRDKLSDKEKKLMLESEQMIMGLIKEIEMAEED